MRDKQSEPIRVRPGDVVTVHLLLMSALLCVHFGENGIHKFVHFCHQASVTYDNSSRSYIMNMTSRDTDKASNYHYKLLERQEAVR